MGVSTAWLFIPHCQQSIANMTLTSHFVRRGMEAAHGMHKHGMMAGSGSDDGSHGKPGDGHPLQIPPVAALVFFLSGLLAIIIMFCIAYTYGHLKLMVKVALIVMACWLLFTMLLVAEAHLLFGDKLGDMMKAMHGMGH